MMCLGKHIDKLSLDVFLIGLEGVIESRIRDYSITNPIPPVVGEVKKGQVTIWIILGIFILLILSAGIYLLTSKEEIGVLLQRETVETQAVNNFVTQCVQTVSGQAIRVIGSQGGWLLSPREIVNTQGIFIPVAYDDGKNLMVSRQQMGDQLAAYMNSQIKECADFTPFEEKGTNVTFEQPITTATISDFQITFDVYWPLTIKHAQTEQRVTRFIHTQTSPLGDMQKQSDLIVERILLDPQFIDLSYLSTLNYNTTTFPHNRSILIYSLIEKDRPNPMMFQFASKHVIEEPPFFLSPDRFSVTDEEPFFFDFKGEDPNGGVEGEDLVFTDNTARFDILPDGKLLYVPVITEDFNATITITDPTGYEYSKTIEFEVKENN